MDEQALEKAAKALWTSVCKVDGVLRRDWDEVSPEMREVVMAHTKAAVGTYLDEVSEDAN